MYPRSTASRDDRQLQSGARRHPQPRVGLIVEIKDCGVGLVEASSN